MITEALVGVGASLVGWIVGLFPDWDPPAWMVETPVKYRGLFEGFADMGVWIDWVALGLVIGTVVTAYVAGFVVRMVRAIVAHIPQFGGGG